MSDAPAQAVEIVRGGDASDEEVAAVMAAVALLLSGGGGGGASGPDDVPRWRFSGRWWTKPIPSRRDRP